MLVALCVCENARESRSESNKVCKMLQNGPIIVNGVHSFDSDLMHLSGRAARNRSLSPSGSEFNTAALQRQKSHGDKMKRCCCSLFVASLLAMLRDLACPTPLEALTSGDL